MDKKLTKRLIALILSGGILLSSTGVYTALATSESATTSEYTSALVGSDDAASTGSTAEEIVVTQPATQTTLAPTTLAPTTQAPTTHAPTTHAPTTRVPTTTQTPTTQPPATKDETTDAPTTEAPSTTVPNIEVETQNPSNNSADEWVGEGTEANPYQVSSAELFLKMSELINDTGNANKYFKLTADIDFSSTTIDQALLDGLAEHHGIGGTLVSVDPEVSSNSNVFFHLDGNGKQIMNVTMNLNSYNSLSIFGYVNSKSTITNLVVHNVSITNGYSDAQAAGVILKNEGNIDECRFSIIVLDTTASTTKAESFYPDNTTLRTYSGTAIVVDNSGVIDYETNFDNTNVKLNMAENVTIKTSRPYAGALVAQNRGKINKVRGVKLTIEGDTTKSTYVGGLVGTNATQRTSSSTGMYYCEIQMDGRSSSVKGADKIGFLVGHNTGRIQRADVTGSFNTNAKATATKYDVLVTGKSAAGGIVGDNTGDVQLCTATNVGVYFADTTDGAIYGGIAGKSNYGIRNCIATGSTAGAGDANAITRYIGGIVGYGDTGNNFGVENCYALVKIIDSKAALGAIVGFNGDEAYKNNKVRNVFYSAIISSRPSPVSYGGAGESEGDLTFSKPYAMSSYIHNIQGDLDFGITKTKAQVSASSFSFSGWGDATFNVKGNFSGPTNASYYTVTGLGTNTLTYELIANGKNDKTVFYYDVDITIPSSIGANKEGTTLTNQPMELGILNSSGIHNTSDYTSDGFIGTKDKPIKLTTAEMNFLYYAPAAHFVLASDQYVDENFTAPAATFWGTINGNGNTITYQINGELFKGIYGSRDDSLQNNNSTTHKSDSSDEADVASNLANGVIRNLTVEFSAPGTSSTMQVSSLFGNVCNATLKNINITFNCIASGLTISPQEGNTGLFAKAVYGNSYLYGCYVDNYYDETRRNIQLADIKTSYNGVSGFIGVIDAEKAIIDNCGADIPIFPEKQSMQNIGIFVGEIKSLEGGYIQNCYASGALIKSGGSFQTSSCNLFAGKISSGSSDTHIYNSYYSPSYLYNVSNTYKDGITTGINGAAFTGSCKVWSFQVKNTATQLWGDASLKVAAASDSAALETINNIDRFDIANYENSLSLDNHFTAASSGSATIDFGTNRKFSWSGRIMLSFAFSGATNASASITARHNATGLMAKLTVFSSSDLEIDGDGYYLIKTPVDLYYLSANQTKLVSGSTEYMYMSTNSKIRLDADIDMSGYTIEPIGTGSIFFKGEFDGAGYTISNLSFGPSNLDQALFGYVQGATIRRLNIDSANIVGASYTGAIVGTVYDYANIDSCKVSNSSISGQNHVGGIVGGINKKAGAQATQITNCTVENTEITSTKNAKEHAYIGGIIGGTSMNSTEGCYAEITGCKVTDCTLSAKAYGIGGVVGYAPDTHNKISSCEVTGTKLTSTASNGVTYASLGAVAGAFGGSTVENCTVTDCKVDGECASGVVSRLINEAGTTSTISGCTVTNSEIIAPDVAGGILAQVSAYATSSCYGDKVVTGCKVLPLKDSNDKEISAVKAAVAGGIVGNVQQFSNRNLTVSGCTNLATVETTGKKGSITDAAGGIVGRLSSGLQTPGILITGCLSQGTVKGNSNLGGIIGMNSANAHTGANKLVKDCYVTTKFTSGNLAVVKGLIIGNVGYQAKNNSSVLAENVVYSSLNTREALFGNIEETSGGFDMNKGADQTRGITVDFTTTITAESGRKTYFPYFMNSVEGYYDGIMGKSNTVHLRTNLYVNSSEYENVGKTYSESYNGTTYSTKLMSLSAIRVPRFSVGNLPNITGTDGNAFAHPTTNVFSTTASSSKIIVGSSSTYNKINDVNIQTFDKKCNATVKTTYTGIINGETVKFDVGFNVVVNGEHAFDGDGTEYNAFLIYTAEDLLAIKQHHDNPSAKDDYKDNPDFYYEAYYCIMNDIDMTEELETEGKSFAPIGTVDEPFRGKITTYHDEQMKISNLLINDPKLNSDYAYNDAYTVTNADNSTTVEYSDALGLFGYTAEGAEIYNVELENVNILAVPGANNKFLGTRSGALVGVANDTIIQNVKVSGASSVAIEGSFGGRAGAVGGIVGQAGNNVVMTDVQFIGSGAEGEDRAVVKGQYCVGGIVGSSADTTGCSITNAHVENTDVTNLATSGVSIAGGIAGQYSGDIIGSAEVKDDEGNVATPATRVKVNNVSVLGTIVGGVVGSGNVTNLALGGCDLTIEDADVTSTIIEVTDTVRADANAGPNGVAGGILGQSCDSYHYYITDCTTDGNTTVTSGYCAGGIVGRASNRGKGQLQTETCLIISDCSTLAKVNQLNAPTTNTLTIHPSTKNKTGAGAIIGVIDSNALAMNEDTNAPQIQIKNTTAGGEISGTFNVGGVVGEFAVYQGKLNELTESIISDCIVSARITPLSAATERFGVIIGSIEGNTDSSDSVTETESNKKAPFPEQDSNGNVVEYAVKPFDKIFYSSYTAGTYDLYGLSVIKAYQEPVHGVFFDTIYDVNKVVYNFETDDGVVELPVSVVKDGFIADKPEASYQWFGDTVYGFSAEFKELLAANEGSGTPFGFSIAGKDFTLVETDGVQSANKEIFEVIANDDGHLGVNLTKYPYKIKVKQFNTADLVFTYTNGLQIGIPVICGVNFEGEGTAENPIQVSNEDIFYHIVKVLPTYSFIQTADLDLSNKTKYPATSLAQLIPNFTGTYDGQNHSITGFDVTIESAESPVGIFSKVSGEKTDADGNVIPNIKDLTFVNCSVNSGECDKGTGVAIGELANGATVSNVKVENSVATSKLGNVGGAIGTVTGASVADKITVIGGTVEAEKGSAGGAIGTVIEDTAKVTSPVVKNTTVTSGSVDTDGNYEGSDSYDDIAGGIVAQARGTIIGPESTETDADGNPIYPNAVEDVTVRALVAGGAVGTVYKTNIAEDENITHELTLKDIRVSGADVTAISKDGTRTARGAGLLGFARAKTDVELNNCYVNNTTKLSSVAASGGTSHGAGAVADVDENVLSLEFIDVESYATVNAHEAGNDGTVRAASLVAYINNAPAIVSFDGCVAGGKITGKAMTTFVGGVIGGFGETFASNEITHELFKNGVISAELECIDGHSNNVTLKSVHRIGKFIAGFADGMFVEANFPTMFSNNYYSTYPNDIAFFATESGEKGPLDAILAQTKSADGAEAFKNINVQENLAIADEFKSGWNSVAITKAIGSETTLYARLSEEYASLPYGSEDNRRNAVAAGGFSLMETAKDAEGNPISCIELIGQPSQTENIGEFEITVKPTDYGAEMLVAEYSCGLKTTAQIISVEIEGDGSEGNPFLISTPTQLRVVAYLTVGNYYFRQINDIDLSNSYAATGTDTDKFIHNNGGKFYAPIGTETAPFDGVYDGQGYKIKGVKSERSNENNIGVFGVVAQNGTLVPTIKNLHVELLAPDQKVNGILGNENVGGIAGKISNAVIENCSVTVGTVTGKQNVGGIAGHFTSSRIINCFTQSDVNAVNSEVAPYAGGIVGYVADAVNNSTISGCFASGSIYASSKDANNDSSKAAGIVSYLANSTDLVIDNCLFTGTTSSGIGLVGDNGQMKFIMTISDCIDAGQNVAMNVDKFTKIPMAAIAQSTRGLGTVSKSNIYYDNALLKVNTTDYPDTDAIKGKPTSELINVSMGEGWTSIAGHYPVPAVSEITVTTYDENYTVTNTETKVDPYSDAYAKFLSAPIQTSEAEEESDITKVAYGQGLVYPVTLLTNVDGNKVTYSSSIFDTTDTVAYPEGFDTALYGNRTSQEVEVEGEDGTKTTETIVTDNKNVDLLFGDDAETGKTTVYRNIFDTTKGIAERGGFDTTPTKNTFVNAGAASGGVFSNKEAYYNAQTPIIFATAKINGVDVQRDIKLALSQGTTYCIATQRQLYALGKAEYELEEGTKFSKYYGSTFNYKLITDIDCGDNETLFTPIGLDAIADGGYTGQFDGSGHTIKNLKIEQTGKDYVGMFAMVSKNWNSPYDPCVKNLTLETPTVVATGTTSGGQQTGGNYVGALIGHVKGSGYTVIENCHVIGYAEYDEKGNILPETVKGSVTGNGSYVGGLIGKVDYPHYVKDGVDSGTIVRSCSSSVLVSGSKDAVGGLIGDSAATVESCYATGNVVCDNIYNNQNNERVFGVGGLIGIMSNGTVNQSFASGNVEVKKFTSGNNAFVNGDLGIGGFVGVVKEMKDPVSQADITGDVITECFSGGNVKFGTENSTSAIRPYTSTAIVGVGGFSGINREGIAHAYSSAAVNATFGDIIARNSGASYGVGIGGVAGVALGNVEDVYSSGSVAPAYASIDSTNNPDNCYFGKGGTVGTKMDSGATVRYCYYDSWTNTDPTLTSIGGQTNNQEARGLTTLELTSGKKPANTTFSDVWGFTPNAYPYLKTLLAEDSDNYIMTNSILSVVCVNVAYDDVSAKTGAGITQALTVPSEFKYTDENLEEHVYQLDWAGATLSGNLAAIKRTRNTREYVDVVAQVKGYEQYATRVYSRLCADMKGTFEQPYLIGNEDDLNHINMTADELAAAKEAFTGFYDQWATPLGDGNEQIEGKVHYQLMSNIDVDETVRKIPNAPASYTYEVTVSDAEGNSTTEEKTFSYQGFMLKGNGYSIKGIKDNPVNVTGYYFNTIDEDSIISNVIFENFTFTGNNSAIVKVNNGTLQDVYVKATIGDGETDISNAAGLVATNTGTIDGCMVDATIKGAKENVGVMAVTNNGTIKNSGTAGTLDTSAGANVDKIGAFVVSNNKTVEDSFSMADVNVLAAENAVVNHVSGFAAINKGTMDGVYTRSAISFANAPADTLTVGSLVGEITNTTDAEPVTNSYAAGLLGYFNGAQDSILFGTVPATMNKLSSVYVDKSLAGEKSANSYKYSASLSSIMSMQHMPDAMKYDATNNPEGIFVAGDADKLTLPQLTSILNAENHQVVDSDGNLIYVDTSVTDKVVTYTIFTETVVEGEGEEAETVSVRKYRCSDGNVYFADGSDNVTDENGTVIVPVENLKLQYAIYLEDKVVIRNYDVIKAYSQISSMTIKTGQSQYADRLAPNSSNSGLNSQVSNVDGIQFNPVSSNNIVGINNGTDTLTTNNTAEQETIKVTNNSKIKLSRGMEIDPTLYIDVAVSNAAKDQLNPNFLSGTGTKEDPYVIDGKDNDAAVASLQSLHYYGTESDLYFVLGDDIDMSGVEDFQIHHFTAHLNDLPENAEDTHQYAIQNFNSTEGHGGLFGTIEDGAVVNNVALTATIEGSEEYTGALANIIKNATVTNCVVSANVTSTATADEYSAPATGILAGIVHENATISGIVTTGNVTASAGVAGGVIGSAQEATISEVLSTANVGEGNTAGIIGEMLEGATLANALYGGVAQSKKPIVGTYVDETAITETYYDKQTNKNIGEEDQVIGTGKSTKECENLTFDDMFMYVDENGGYYPVPVTIVDTIGIGVETSHEGYGSTAALAAATMNFYLGSTYGQIGYYTSMQFINMASGSAVTATEEGNGGYFSIVSGDKVYTIKTAKFNEEMDPGISFSLENGAVRTVYPGLVRNANISYTIVNGSDLDVTNKTLGVLFKSVAEKGSADNVQVLNDFTNEIGVEQTNIDALAIAKEVDGFYVGEMLPDGYEYVITATLGGQEISSDNIQVEENIYGTYIKLPDVKDAEGNTATDVELTLTIVKSDRPWGVNSVKNILW